MTWSILARDDHGRFGVAIASRFFAVGALCVHMGRGVGALSTQALMNPLYGPAGIALLGGGRTAAEVVATLIEADAGSAQRQLHVMPASGPAVAHTGSGCIEWCGHQVFADFSVAGNMLAGPLVIAAIRAVLVASMRSAAPESCVESPRQITRPGLWRANSHSSRSIVAEVS